MAAPRSTYRVQISPDFDLAATADLADYLAALGATHLYASPLLTAMPGSLHGYDVGDHSRVSPELGGEDARQRLVEALGDAGLGLVADIVPNHMGVRVPAANPAWWDLLRHGPDSAYASWFDVDWSGGRLLLPVLDDKPEALAELAVEDGELRYGDLRLPLAPGTGDGDPQEVHARQHYELIPSGRGNQEINYRRFFAVSELAAIRVEDPRVFDATHAEVLRWRPDGIRADHPDGLRDPAAYLARLRAAAPDAWLLVEKILHVGEELPDWPVAGTTGYDALREVCGVFVDPAGEAAYTALDTELTGAATHWEDLTYACKRTVATTLLAAELGRLERLAPGHREALLELVCCFPVYRAYPPDGADHVAAAVSEAGRRRPHLDAEFAALAPRLVDPDDELAIRFAQVASAVMAKGVEDTAYYRWTRFVALNEVGGDPALFGLSVAQFHAAALRRSVRHPAGMTTLSTHDTKRSADVRARLAVLAERPAEWADVVRRVSAEAALPDPAFAHLLWQTVAGAWPIERERLHAYVEKASREAGASTSWADPDEQFEGAMHAVVDRFYDDPDFAAVLTDFAADISADGWTNALGQKLVQLTMPGVPDTYQGDELWDNSLVDPDNRRPVDFALRRELLARLDTGWQPPVDAGAAAKLLVTSRALRLRRDRPELFTAYTPVAAAGEASDHVLAFDRGGALTVATRLPTGLARAGGWRDTVLSLPPGDWRDAFTAATWQGGLVPLADLLATYPVALLVREAV